MEDEKIKELFQGFQPELTPDRQFIERLQRSMDAVEIVRRQNARERRRGRIAVAVAALSGFLAGVVLTLLYPAISGWLSTVTFTLPGLGLPVMTLDAPLVTWSLIAATSALISLHVYDLALSRQTAPSTK